MLDSDLVNHTIPVLKKDIRLVNTQSKHYDVILLVIVN